MSGDMTDWSGLKASWKASSTTAFDAERIRALKSRIDQDVRRTRVLSLLEMLATLVICFYLAWQSLSRSSFTESLILMLLAIATLSGQGVIMLMRRRLSLKTADTAKALWTLKASRAQLAYRVARLGLVAGPLGVLVGYLLATQLGVSTEGDDPIVSAPVAIGCVVLLAVGMLYAALEAWRAKRDLREAEATLSWLGDDEA